MKYHDNRAHGIALLREHVRQEVTRTGDVRSAYRQLKTATEALLQEFLREFDLPGVRYWEHPETRVFTAIAPGEHISKALATECVELARHEFLSRQSIHFGYDEDAL